MKTRTILIALASILLLALTTCKKDPQPIMERFDLSRENLTAGTISASIEGTYTYPGTIDEIMVYVSEDGVHPTEFVADINGKNFTVEMTGLSPATSYQYYYSVDYGFSKPFITETKSFTTLSESPTVRTIDVISIDSTTVRVNCETVSDGGVEITERGVCWNTYGNPDLDDESQTYTSAGIGRYSCRISGLALSTKYYFRAYAKNASGVGFGEVLEFETLAEAQLPEVSTVEVSDVASTSATCMGNVASDGGLELTGCGVCWSLSANPSLTDSHAAADAALGVFQVAMTGLTPSKTYHVRAYATNAKGTAYGDDLTFTTTEGLPVVATSGITEITATSAKGGGEVTDQGASTVTERGICWSMSHNPTTSGTHANSGTGAGGYTVSMTNLTPNTTYYVRAYATNGQGTAYGAEVSFTALEGLPVVQTLDITDITSTTAKGHGKVTDQGGSAVTERGICWDTSPSPSTSGSHAGSGTGAGEYTVSLSNLTPGTRYYVRAYATNGQGTTYGEQKDFTTAATLPTVVTGDINGTTVSGEVTSDGGATVTERGICWSTSHNPTTEGDHSSSGTGTGTFSIALTDLEPGTTYYVRAYATNAKGTAYGSEKTLTTQATPPTVTTGDVSNIHQTEALGSGSVTDDGGATVTERGVCWSTSHNPTISGSCAHNGTGTGGYTVDMTGLTANTHYYVRAYAKNSAGVSYGNEVEFTTSQDVSAPTVTTSQVTDVTQTTATGGGDVTNDGGATVTERGLCWSTSHNPTTSGSHATSGTGTGTFTVNMTGLTPGTTYYVRAYAMNSQGTSYGSEVSFTTQQAVTVPTVTTAKVTNITQTTATGGGNVTSNGNATVTERGICWGISHNPTISGSHASNGTGTGSFSVNMTDLTAGTTYYVRAYAINSEGTAYGSEVSFTTTANLPTVTTTQVTNVTQTSATGGGNVTATGGASVTERGICWSTSHDPTTSGSHASNGTGTGSFSVNMTGLTAGTTYYVRAYAINSEGTAYGSEVSFTTTANLPTVTTTQVTNVTQTTATGGGNVTNDGGATVTERGICWSTSHNPTTSGSHANSGTGTGTFSINMTGLTNNTTYYVRAYAINSAGTAYGSEVSFTTSQIPTYTISVSANPTNGGTVNGGGTYQQGNSCTVSATAASGYNFVNWTEGGSVVSSSASYTFTVNSSRDLVANFTLQVTLPTVNTSQVTNITQSTATGGGNVTATGGASVTERGICWSTSHNPTTNGSHASNGTGTGSFTVNMTGLTANTTYYVCAYAINSAGTAYGNEVSFTTSQIPTYTISVSANPSNGGTVTGGGTYQQGQSCTVSATSAMGYTFVNWTEGSSVVSSSANYTFTVTGSRALVANFTAQSYTISASANPSSGGSVSGGGGYDYGQSCTVSATAATGYTFTNWTEGGSVVSSSANYTFTVTGSRTLVANFTAQNYTISVSANPSSGGSVSGGGNYTYGQSCTVSATASTGYTFTNWTEGSSVVSSSANYTFTVTGSRTLVANFTAQSYTISVSANPSNGGTVSGGGTYNYGQSCTISATSASTHNFSNWTENGNVVSTDSSYTFTVTNDRTLVANFTAIPVAPTGAINGLFSVSETQQVWFSQGNLQYRPSTNTWRFATNQYDYIGEANLNISQYYSGWIDLFGWGTSGYNHGAVCYQPWGTSTTNSHYYAYGQYFYNLYEQTGKADWGYNAISNGGNITNIWRTLTKEEWIYVMDTRNTISGIRYAKAQVDNINGLILLPDNWNNSYSLNNTNQSNANYSSNVISITQWNSLQNAGAVFLPAAGVRFFTQLGHWTILSLNSGGEYWSASYENDNYIYIEKFGNNYLLIGHEDRWVGNSVRLVQDVE